MLVSPMIACGYDMNSATQSGGDLNNARDDV